MKMAMTACHGVWRHRGQVVPEDLPDMDLYGMTETFYLLYRPWLARSYDKWFTPEVLDNTMLSRLKLYVLLSYFDLSLGVAGDVMEAGTGSGGSARLLVNRLDETLDRRRVWVLDTFQGYQNINAHEDGLHVRPGDCACAGVTFVKKLLLSSSVDVRIVEGTIPETLACVKAEAISFAHIDVNLYHPTLMSTVFALERMPKGGVIVFDDYNWPATYGARKAIDEAAARFGQLVVSIPGSTQAVMIKK
jgi:O-methyltransferase